MTSSVLFSVLSSMSDSSQVEEKKDAVLVPLAGREDEMRENHAGGFVFKVADKDYLLRILILGTTKNSYYQNATEVSAEALQFVKDQIASGNGQMVLDTLDEVYRDGRAPRQNNLAVVHALLTRAGLPLVAGKADEHLALRKGAYALVAKYRTLSQLYSWKAFDMTVVKSKGFGSGAKAAVSQWLLGMDPTKLAYQVSKYQSRTTGDKTLAVRDLLRMAHPKTGTGEDRDHKLKGTEAKEKGLDASPHDVVLRYIVDGLDAATTLAKKASLDEHPAHVFLQRVESAKGTNADDEKAVEKLCDLIYSSQADGAALVREHMPTWALKNVDVLNALLMNKDRSRVVMPMTALLRNLGNLSTNGVFDHPATVELVVHYLTNEKVVKGTRAHPVQVMIAWATYKSGHGVRGSNSWRVVSEITKALEEMFYLSFKNCAPTGKRICFGIDCSGSMRSPSAVPQISNADAAALLAMVFSRSECDVDGNPIVQHTFKLFTASDSKRSASYGGYSYSYGHGREYGLTDVSDLIHAKASFAEVHDAVQRSNFGATDPSLPVLDALKHRQLYDAFVIITDNEVNSGTYPSAALKEYRKLVPGAKIIMVATEAVNFSIADPADGGMMDVVGFDSHGPKLMQDFVRGAPVEASLDDDE